MWTCRGPPVQALCYRWFKSSLSHKSKCPTWHLMQQSMLLCHWMRPNANATLTIMMTVIATIIVTSQHMHKTTAQLQLNRLQQATIVWYWCSRSWSQTVVGQPDDRFTHQLPFLLAHMPKSDCLCNCAHECIRCNVDYHHCECLPVLKGEGVCHGAVGIVSQRISYLMRSQICCN